jgi:RNA polymerase sigma-70 factor (ECF subfamily)
VGHHRSRKRRDGAIDRIGSQLASDWDEVAGIDVDDEAWFAAVRSLPRRQRDVVALHYIGQIPIAEVADVLDVATGTVKSSLARARRTLARRFPNEEGTR